MNDELIDTFEDKISERVERVDKNGRTYLIVRLENGGSIFVFDSLVSESNWKDFQVGQEYSFTTKEGKNGNKLLVEFSPLTIFF